MGINRFISNEIRELLLPTAVKCCSPQAAGRTAIFCSIMDHVSYPLISLFSFLCQTFLLCNRIRFCSCQVRNKKKLIFFINGEPLARFPMLLLYNFVFSLLLLIIPSSSLKVIKVPSDFNMLIIIHQHIINEISDYFFIKLIQLTKLC